MSKPEMELETYIDQSAGSDSAENAFITIDEFDAMLSNKNHDHLTNEIVASLGGIDKMLIEYIRITREHEKEQLLCGPDMQNIANIISTAPEAPTDSMWDYLYKRANLMDNTFHFCSSDTVWHSICADPHVADRIVAAMFSKYTRAFVGTAFLIYAVCFVELTMWHFEGLYAGTALAMLAILVPYSVLMILCCNIPSLLLILCTFDFWVKVAYMILLGITGLIYLRGITVWSAVGIAVWHVNSVFGVLFIINLSLIEGYHGSWKISFITGLVLSLTFSWRAVALTFNVIDSEEQELELWSGYFIGLDEYMAMCYRVLSLFSWRQTLMALYTRGSACICIYLSPYIKWVHGDVHVTYRRQSTVSSKK